MSVILKESKNLFERRPALTLIIVVLLSVLLIDVVAAQLYKICTGHAWSQAQEASNKRYRIRSPIYHHDLAPSKNLREVLFLNSKHPFSTNSLGFKDAYDRQVPLRTDKYRILFIGDSFTEGVGLRYEDTFVGRIDEALRGSGIEVLNAGVASYSPIIYWRKLKYLIEKVALRFNELVVYIDISDVQNEATGYYLTSSGDVMMQDEGGSSVSRSLKDRIGCFIRYNTILVHYLIHRWAGVDDRERIGYSYQTSAWTVDQLIYERYALKGLNQASLYMDRLYQLVMSKGIRMTIAVYPWPEQIRQNDLNSIQVRFWREWCRARQVDFIDYFPFFVKGASLKDRQEIIKAYFIDRDVHWNKEGHQQVARIFLERYAQKQKERVEPSDLLTSH